jgi:hypothetical protein
VVGTLARYPMLELEKRRLKKSLGLLKKSVFKPFEAFVIPFVAFVFKHKTLKHKGLKG